MKPSDLNSAIDTLQTFDARYYRNPRSLNLTLLRYAILGVDGHVLAIRKYPPIKPKDLSRAMAPIPDGAKVTIGMRYHNGEFHDV